jgi:hypothetical protein
MYGGQKDIVGEIKSQVWELKGPHDIKMNTWSWFFPEKLLCGCMLTHGQFCVRWLFDEVACFHVKRFLSHFLSLFYLRIPSHSPSIVRAIHNRSPFFSSANNCFSFPPNGIWIGKTTASSSQSMFTAPLTIPVRKLRLLKWTTFIFYVDWLLSCSISIFSPKISEINWWR